MVVANWMPDLLLVGGRCDLTRASEPSCSARWEDVVAYDPEVIVVMPYGFADNRASYQHAWCTLSLWPVVLLGSRSA